MGTYLYFGFYHKKCKDPDVLPYLEIHNDNYDYGHCNGRENYVGKEFYKNVKELSTEHNEENNCYIFEDMEKLFKFAEIAPYEIDSYIVNWYEENYKKDHVFILWIR